MNSDRKTVMIGGGVLLLLIVLVAVFQPDEDVENQSVSSYSAKSGGAKATYLIIGKLGYHVDRWTKSLAELPPEPGALLVLSGGTGRYGNEDEKRLEQFLSAGGSVLAAGSQSAYLLPGETAFPLWKGDLRKSWVQYEAAAPTDITRAVPKITMPERGAWRSTGDGVVPLYGDNNLITAVQYNHGKGRVIWVGAAALLSNASMKLPENTAFLAATLASVDPQKVYWFEPDERSEAIAWSKSPAMWALVGQLVLVFCFLLWTFSRRSGPLCAPRKVLRLSPMEFVEALGDVYQQRKAYGVAVGTEYKSLRALLLRKFGVSADAPVDRAAQVIANHVGNISVAEVDQLLKDAEFARFTYDLVSKDAVELSTRLAELQRSLSHKEKQA